MAKRAGWGEPPTNLCMSEVCGVGPSAAGAELGGSNTATAVRKSWNYRNLCSLYFVYIVYK
jgi:hypothetical protein